MEEIYLNFIKEMSKKDKVLICGTGKSIEYLEDKSLVDKINEKFNVFCVNTSHYYFQNIDVLFIGNNCNYSVTAQQSHFTGKNIKYLIGDNNNINLNTTFIKTELNVENTDRGLPTITISTNITKKLPHGPTTILDLAIPTALFCGMKKIYLLGAEYPRSVKYERFNKDFLYREQVNFGFKPEMEWAYKKWDIWKEYFKNNKIEVFNFSQISELSFKKVNINEI